MAEHTPRTGAAGLHGARACACSAPGSARSPRI